MDTVKKRSILLEVCGNVTFQDVIDSNPILSDLPEILNGLTIDKFKKKITAQRKKHNEALISIPARIDENMLKMPVLDGLALADLREQKAAFESGTGDALARQKIDLKISKFENEFLLAKNADLSEQSKALKAAEKKRYKYVSEKVILVDNFKNKEVSILNIDTRIENMRGKWHVFSEKKFTQRTCHACGQELVGEALESAQRYFNEQKAEELQGINTKGKYLQKKKESLKTDIKDDKEQIEKLDAKITALDSDISDVKKTIAEIERTDITEMEEHKKLISERDNLPVIDTFEAEQIDRKIQMFETAKEVKKRDLELQNEERETAQKIEICDQLLALCETFVKTESGLLENTLNDKFELTKWKLFKHQKNGGVKDICEAVDHEGVPYARNLNQGHKMRIDIDIINTLSQHYGIYMPVFIDHCESVTDIPVMQNQVIYLYKPEITAENKKYYAELRLEK